MKSRLLCMAGAIVLACSVPVAVGQDEAEQPDAQGEGGVEDFEEGRRSVRRLGDVIGGGDSEFSMDIPEIDAPAQPVREQPDVMLPDPAMDDRLQNILERRALVPDNPEIEAELAALLDEVETQADQALASGDVGLATRLANVIGAFDDDRAIVEEVAAARERDAGIERLLGEAEQALEDGALVEPSDTSAWGLYQQILALDDDNETALRGLEAVRAGLLARIDVLLEQGDFGEADALLAQAAERGADPAGIEARTARIEAAREDQKRALIDRMRAAIDGGDFGEAEEWLNELISLGLESQRVSRLRASLDDAMRYLGFEPGQLFQDYLEGMDAYGPVMVVMPTGSFMMGSPENEDGRVGNEGPRFRVTFERGFALSRNEITVAQFRRFVEDTGYETDAERAGASRIYMAVSGRVSERRRVTWRDDYLGEPADDEEPVIHVSWNDANAYAEWLAEQTDRPYRLPTEAEFEYALRAGSQTPYWWGEGSPDEPLENVTGDGDEFRDQRQWTSAFRRYTDGFWGPAPVGSLQANPFRLFDMGGNVMEWVADCWHDSYVRAPDDGSAWVNPGCERRVIRGASWSSTPAMSRSALRLSSRPEVTDARVGFRVARDL